MPSSLDVFHGTLYQLLLILVLSPSTILNSMLPNIHQGIYCFTQGGVCQDEKYILVYYKI
jgi:hypothetical protein